MKHDIVSILRVFGAYAVADKSRSVARGGLLERHISGQRARRATSSSFLKSCIGSP